MRKLFAIAILALAAPAWSQDDAAVKACWAQSRAVRVDSPLKVVQAQKDAFDACVAMAILDKQRQTLALFRNAQAGCNNDVKNALNNDPLTTTYEQGEIFRKCMARPPGKYVVQ